MKAPPRWVLLRGLTRESRHWGAFPEALQTALGGVQVLTPDLPGNGLLHDRRSPARIGEMVESCRAELQSRGIAPPYGILALSLGAMVAVDWAKHYADEAAALVLINTSLRPFNSPFERLRPRAYGDAMALALGSLDPLQAERIILRRTSYRRGNDEALAATWADIRRQCPVATGNAWRQLLAASRFRAPAAAPAAPTLLLAGERDALVDPICSAKIATRWNADIAIHPDAGHDLPLDAPDWVVQQVRLWIDRDGR